MQDSKEMSWANGRDADKKTASNDHTDDADGWQQYRKWISKAPAPRKKRMGVDPSLYTWKGYRNWTEQVKRNWSDNS
jgi:hypothetical protein